jgi:transmembrane sensor
VELTGEGYFEVAKNPSKPFQVHAGGTVVQVLGTHFNINSYQDNKAVVATLLEGSIRMQKGETTTLLTPGQQGSVANGADAIKVEKADLKEVMGWKNGFFVFHDEDIATVMRQVSRWYDVDVEYMEDVKDREFGGTVSRYKDVTELLNNMELTEAIHYKIVGRRVLIMR